MKETTFLRALQKPQLQFIGQFPSNSLQLPSPDINQQPETQGFNTFYNTWQALLYYKQVELQYF